MSSCSAMISLVPSTQSPMWAPDRKSVVSLTVTQPISRLFETTRPQAISAKLISMPPWQLFMPFAWCSSTRNAMVSSFVASSRRE
jgi:hypothetical protein